MNSGIIKIAYVKFAIRSSTSNNNDKLYNDSAHNEFGKNEYLPNRKAVSDAISIDDLILRPWIVTEFRATMDYSPWSNNEHTVSDICITITFY